MEVAVDMRRYDEDDTLARCLRVGEAGAAARGGRSAGRLPRIRAAARTAGPRCARRCAAPCGRRSTTFRTQPAGRRSRAHSARSREVMAMEAALAARRVDSWSAARGLVVDGHGDLRAEHVLLTDPVQLVDALEFDPPADRGRRMRHRLPGHGSRGRRRRRAGRGARRRLPRGRRRPARPRAAGDFCMACYRALVRQGRPGARGCGSERARERIEQAVRLGWQARGPQLIAVCGTAGQRAERAPRRASQSAMAHLSRQTSSREARAACGNRAGSRDRLRHEATLSETCTK